MEDNREWTLEQLDIEEEFTKVTNQDFKDGLNFRVITDKNEIITITGELWDNQETFTVCQKVVECEVFDKLQVITPEGLYQSKGNITGIYGFWYE